MKYNEDTKNIRKDFLKIMEKYQLVDWSVALELFVMSLDYILEKEKEMINNEPVGYIKRKKLLKQILWITKEEDHPPETERDNMDEIFKQLSRRIKDFWI